MYVVVKVGGSLFDLPDLGPRLERWLEGLHADGVLLVPGGGAAADVVRAFDRAHSLGPEAAHWLALRAMSLNAHFLASLLPGTPVVGEARGAWDGGCRRAILDGFAFARADEDRPGPLPHTWVVTSDSVAARAAHRAGARLLFLLKSITIPEGTDWAEAGRLGWVDEGFARVVPSDLAVRTVNFRALCEGGGNSPGENLFTH